MIFKEFGNDNKDVITLLHGGGLSWWNYKNEIELLKSNYHIILPILNGHGGSDKSFISIEDNADEIINFIDEKFEAGIALHGTEVKSLRMGHCSIKEAFVSVEDGEVIIRQMHISPYEKGNIFNRDPLRPRKLLLHKYEINKIMGQAKMKGYTIVPLKVYFKDSLVKVEIGLARGKKLYDKRNDIAKKDMKREAEKEFKIRNMR